MRPSVSLPVPKPLGDPYREIDLGDEVFELFEYRREVLGTSAGMRFVFFVPSGTETRDPAWVELALEWVRDHGTAAERLWAAQAIDSPPATPALISIPADRVAAILGLSPDAP